MPKVQTQVFGKGQDAAFSEQDHWVLLHEWIVGLENCQSRQELSTLLFSGLGVLGPKVHEFF